MHAPEHRRAHPSTHRRSFPVSHSQNPEVSLLAEGILEQWLGSIVAHTLVLSSDRYVMDPRKTLAVK